MDDLIYAQYLDDVLGYGVFAKIDLEKDIIIGKYAGEIVADRKNKKYSWTYKSVLD
jgi:hypothetical protein